MSTVKLSPLITDVIKRMGNIVFSRWKHTNYARQYSQNQAGDSERQVEVRSAFTAAVSLWRNAGTTLHATWNAWAETLDLNMSGYNAFIKTNLPRILEGSELELFKSTGGDEPVSLFAGSGAGQGEIVCAFTMPQGIKGRHVIFFAQRIENGKPSGELSLHEEGADPASPFIITGLEPGAEYFVYAIIADNDYANAVTVSASVCIRTNAGM